MVKIYFPRESESHDFQKAWEEARKNANTALAGAIAVIFDAGEYQYPCKLWYSIMESVSFYCTIKQWRAKRDEHFPTNKYKFDIDDIGCRCSIHASINLAVGFLKSVITLYENNTVHGDLNPGNILWILEKESLDDELERYSSHSYSVLGVLELFHLKLIDMGTSRLSEEGSRIGRIRDAWELYDQMRSFLSPLFVKRRMKFIDWFRFEISEPNERDKIGVKKVITARKESKRILVPPQQMAGDFFRLLCVLTLGLGIITNSPSEEEGSIPLNPQDRRDFYVLMYEREIDYIIDAFSLESIIVLPKLSAMGSDGCLIIWENVWKSYPLNRIDISPVFEIKKRDEINT